MRAWSAACLLVVTGARSLSASEDEKPVPDEIRDTNNSLSISALARRVQYSETNGGLLANAPETLDTENGWIRGFLIEGRVQQPWLGFDAFFFRARVALTWGDLDYDGGTQMNEKYVPLTATTGASMTDVSFAAGAGIGLGSHAALTPLVSYAFRFWKRSLNPGLGGYHEEYASHELGAGAMVQFVLGERLNASVSGLVGGIFHASIYIQPVPAASLDLGPSFSVHGEVSLDYKIVSSPLVRLFGAYDVCSFGFGRSPMKPTNGVAIIEPDSATLQHEVRGGLLFGF